MGLSMKQMALFTSFFGVLSFICGVIAENKKPAAGTPIPGKGVVICKYPYDPSVVLGYISVAGLIVSTIFGYTSLFYPYNKRAIPYGALFGEIKRKTNTLWMKRMFTVNLRRVNSRSVF